MAENKLSVDDAIAEAYYNTEHGFGSIRNTLKFAKIIT